MADDLDALIAKTTQHLKDKKGELLALNTQLEAGRSAQADLHKELTKTQDKLKEVRDLLADADSQLDARRKDADGVASQIINAAHGTKAAAAKIVKDAENKAKGIVAEAEARAYAIETRNQSLKAEEQAALNQLNAVESRKLALKKQLQDAADSIY